MNALVTGASSGIGKEIATLLAARGYHLILVARRRDLLDELAAQLPYGATVIERDLAQPGAAEALFAEVRTQELEVQVLVNNAGFGRVGDLCDCDLRTIEEMNYLNMVTLASLCRLFAEPMLAKGEGSILNLGSVAGNMPIPGMSNYAATKSFVSSFSWGLYRELRPKGVQVCLLTPGPTISEFGSIAKPDGDFYSGKPGVMTAHEVAQAGLEALFAGEPEVIPGPYNRAVPFLLRLLPKRWVVELAHKWANR